jgi:hypothetical protein
MTEAEYQRLLGQKCTRHKRRSLLLGANRPMWSQAMAIPQGWRIVYVGWLPSISNHHVHWRARAHLSKLTRDTFGTLPKPLCIQRYANVEVVRVLGPRQKPMDRDSLAQLTAGCLDGLQPLYLWNDSERWANITYTNCSHRRSEGPYIEMTIHYDRT